VCHITGLTARTLHYYDEIGLLVPSERLAGGQRLYTAADLDRIQRIKELKRLLGLSLSEIKQILDAEDQRERHLAAAAQAPDEPARRAALERALGVTEAQWRSVQEKIAQLAQFGRKLERQVREVRRLLEARASRAGTKLGTTPSVPVPVARTNGFGPRPAPRAKTVKSRHKTESKAARTGAPAEAAGGER
jgi:DNA-binding transcriptional MerR regulator